MAVRYKCNYCNTVIGKIDQTQVDAEQLGFHSLTPEERESIITYNQSGDIEVSITCDYCNEALQQHPELILVRNPLQ